MTRVELKSTNLLQYFENDYIVCKTSQYMLPFIHKGHVTVSLYNCQTTLLLEKYAIHVYVLDHTVVRNIKSMSLDMWIWRLIYDTLICQTIKNLWMNEFWKVFPQHSNNMTSWTSSSAENVSYGDTTSCIRLAIFINFKGKFTKC